MWCNLDNDLLYNVKSTFNSGGLPTEESVACPGGEGVGSVGGGHGTEAARRIGHGPHGRVGTGAVKVTVRPLLISLGVGVWNGVSKIQHVHILHQLINNHMRWYRYACGTSIGRQSKTDGPWYLMHNEIWCAFSCKVKSMRIQCFV